ncbi:MAG: hypothetical protein WHS82_02835 [Candidatus Methanosuratincola sp.]
MDDFALALTIALVGMSVTILLLAALASIFHILGRYEQRRLLRLKAREVAAPPTVTNRSNLVASVQAPPGAVLSGEDDAFVAAGIYLYLCKTSREPSSKPSSKSIAEECRKEWKRSSRLFSVGLRE